VGQLEVKINGAGFMRHFWSGKQLQNRAGNLTVSLVLLALSAWLGWRLLDGTLSYYLHPRFNLLIALTGITLAFLGGWILQKQLLPGQPSGQVVNLKMLLPVCLIALAGLLVMPRPLSNVAGTAQEGTSGSNINRALTEAVQKQTWEDPATLETAKWNLLDWSAALNNAQRAEKLVGSPVDVTGFVILPANTTQRYFFLARYVVVCCTADSTTLRLPVVASKNIELEADQWVRVRGSVGRNSTGGIVFNATDLEITPPPAQPYIYP